MNLVFLNLTKITSNCIESGQVQQDV